MGTCARTQRSVRRINRDCNGVSFHRERTALLPEPVGESGVPQGAWFPPTLQTAWAQAMPEGESEMKSSNPTHDPADASQVALSLRQLSIADWARFGVQEIAYIRPVVVNGVHAMSIHAADGTPIGAAPNEELAVAAILQHEMAPALVH